VSSQRAIFCYRQPRRHRRFLWGGQEAVLGGQHAFPFCPPLALITTSSTGKARWWELVKGNEAAKALANAAAAS